MREIVVDIAVGLVVLVALCSACALIYAVLAGAMWLGREAVWVLVTFALLLTSWTIGVTVRMPEDSDG